MTIEEMQQRKRELGLTNQDIADRCGLSVPTVQRIMTDKEYSARTYTKAMIEMVLQENPVLHKGEAAYKYGYMKKKQGEYTVDDYFELPDDEKYELIDGVIYDIASPTLSHQDIATSIGIQLYSFVKENKGKCKVISSPLDLTIGKKTVIQPDVMVICDRSKTENGKLKGAPDLVMEVTSPSTKSRDHVLKLNKYKECGVREYWIVDLKADQILVYLFGEEWGTDEDISLKMYSFKDKVPVSIWGGKCYVDFEEIKNDLWE